MQLPFYSRQLAHCQLPYSLQLSWLSATIWANYFHELFRHAICRNGPLPLWRFLPQWSLSVGFQIVLYAVDEFFGPGFNLLVVGLLKHGVDGDCNEQGLKEDCDVQKVFNRVAQIA